MKHFFSSIRTGVVAMSGILLMTAAFTACNKLDNDDNNNTPVAGLLVSNLAPDITNTNITLSGNNLSSGSIPYNGYTGGYLPVYIGERPVASYNTSNGSKLDEQTFTFEDGKYYSMFVVGANSSYRNVIVNDNLDSLSAANAQAYVRYINAVPGTTNPTVTIASNGSNVVNDNAVFAAVSDFVAVTPGDVAIHVTNGGTIDASRTITLESNKVYTVLVAGLENGTGDQAVQIKYITNGSLSATGGRTSNSAARASN
jgi:hypothetical protein